MNLDAHPATTPEIRSLCEDLGVLGKVDFKLEDGEGGPALVVDVDEPDSRAAQTIDEDAWREKTRVSVSNIYQTARQNGYGPAHVETAVANASLVCDMLTAESIVGMLGEPVLDGAWPDVLHMPGGFPLTIAFAIRIACYPQRYGLPPASTGGVAPRWLASSCS